MPKKIIWSAKAKAEFLSVLAYWKKRNASTTYSEKLKLETERHILLLSSFPELGKRTEIDTIRSSILNNYSIFYSASKSTIRIISFWDNRQNPECLKKNLSF